MPIDQMETFTGRYQTTRVSPLTNSSATERGSLKQPSKKVKKSARPAKPKRAQRRPVSYEEIAKLWAEEKTIPEIAKAIGRVGKGDDRYHALRVVLTHMHEGYRDSKGEIVKLPHRISQKTLKLATKAGKRASA
jgi:hypothetical protein